MGIFTLNCLLVLAAISLPARAASPANMLESSARHAAQQWLENEAVIQGWQSAEFTLSVLPLRQNPPPCHDKAQANVALGSEPARLYVNVHCDGRQYRFLLRANVSAILPVATRDIPAGQSIQSDNIRLQRISISQPQALALNTNSIDGLSSRLAIKAGSPFYLQQLQKKVLVTRGMIVDIRAAQEDIAVNMTGEAQEAGRLEEWITVKNIRSGKIIKAKVIAAGVVTPQIIHSPATDEIEEREP